MNNRFLLFVISIFACLNMQVQGFFTLIDDDANSVEVISSIKKIVDEKGIKITFGVKAGRIIQTKDVCQQLLQYQEEGHQIVNHSLSHSEGVWKNPQQEVIERELIESEKILDSLGFRNHDYLVYPWGRFKTDVREWMLPLVGKRFKLAFDSRGGSTDLHDYNRYYIHRFPIRKHDNISIVKHEIDKAAANGVWIVFLTHSGMERDFDPEYVGEVIDYCQKKGMKSLTVQEAYEMLEAKGALRTDATEDWTTFDEIRYLLYMHLWWCVWVGIGIIVIITGIYIKFKK